MDTQNLGKHTIYVKQPANGLKPSQNCAIFLNDGQLIPQFHLQSKYALLIGIVPRDRLSQYTPWAQKALRADTPDFGGELKTYHHQLLTEILPVLTRSYQLDGAKLAYGGFSLGGLAATMSLWQTKQFRWVFSICGSFWYPGVVQFIKQNEPLNQSAHVFLLNGEKEGKNHLGCLNAADRCASQVHDTLSKRLHTYCVMDSYAHHQQQAQRFACALQWLDQQFLKS